MKDLIQKLNIYSVVSFEQDHVVLSKRKRKETSKEKKRKKEPPEKSKIFNYLIRLPYLLFTRQRLNKNQS